MIRRLLKTLLARGSETLLAIGLVLGFFLVFWTILNLGFPRGSSLRELMSFSDPQDISGRVWPEGEGGPGTEAVATLVSIERTVRVKPASDISWSDAAAGRGLSDQDTVQTLDRSRAGISFPGSGQLTLGEKTLLVIRRLETRRFTGGREAEVLLLGGSVAGSMRAAGENATGLIVSTPDGQARIASRGDRPADFTITKSEGEGTTFSATGGALELTVNDRHIVIESNHALTVEEGKPVGEPVRMMPAPNLTEPANGLVLTTRTPAARVRFTWEGVRGATGYAIEIARDARFVETLHSSKQQGTGFTHGNLKPGLYYWRVRALSQTGEGPFATPRKVEVRLDTEPPSLDVGFPAGVVERPRLNIAGSTEPGASVFIGGERVPSDGEGRFSWDMDLERGPNVVVVESVDAAGNISYRSEVVNARY